MGTFERIRKMSPYALGLFAVLFILFMVLADMDPGSLMQNSSKPVAVIEGLEITYPEFETRNRQQLEYQKYQLQQQGRDPEEVDDANIRAQTWNSLVDQKAFEYITDNAGMILNEDVVSDELIYNPPQNIRQSFTDSTGNFQMAQYQQFVTNPEAVVASSDPNGQLSQDRRQKIVSDIRTQIISAAEQVKGNMIERGVRNMIQTAGSFVSNEYAKAKYINENSYVDFKYVKFDVSSIADDKVEVTDDKLQSYYNEVKPYLVEDEKRKIKYVSFRLQPSDRDSAKAKEKVNNISDALRNGLANGTQKDAFNNMMSQYGGETSKFLKPHEIDANISRYIATLPKESTFGPVKIDGATHFFRIVDKREADDFTVNASHILIRTNDNKDSALKIAKDIIKRAKSGEDFAMLASEFSEDRGSAIKGGELGWFGKGQMVEEFETAAFAQEVGGITNPIESQFGYHIIKVHDKTKEELKYAQITVEPKMSSVSKNLTFRNARSFYVQVAEQGKDFDAISEELGVKAIETAYFTKDQAILGNNFVTHFAFENAVGTVSEPIEVNGYGVVVFIVDGVLSPGAPPLEEKKNEIMAYAKREMILDMLKEEADNAKQSAGANLVGTGKDVKTATNVKNNGSVPGMSGKEWALTEAAYNAPLNTVVGPIRGDTGYYLIYVTSRSLTTDELITKNLDAYRNRLMSNLERQVYYPWFRDLKGELNIEDNRHLFYNNY